MRRLHHTPHHTARRTRRLVLYVALATAVAACGSDGGGNAAPPDDGSGEDALAAACSELSGLTGATAKTGLATIEPEAPDELRGAIESANAAVASGDLAAGLAAGADLAEACDDPGIAETVGSAWHLPGSEVSVLYTCLGADTAAQGLISLFGSDVQFSPTLSLADIERVPAEGDAFEASFTGSLELSGELVDGVIGLGITQADIQEMSVTIGAGEGVEGDDVVGRPEPASFELVAGEPVSLAVGPYEGPFTRVAPLGTSFTFTPGTLDLTLATVFNGTPINLALTCAPEAGAALSTVEAVKV